MLDQDVCINLKDADVTGVDISELTLSLKRLLLGAGKQHRQWEMPILQGINLEIRSGERVGIVGLNGCGKTTLLKVLAGIYPLQKGSREIRGSVAPILEMGLGFDPYSSGRVNIKLALLHSGRFSAYSPELESQVIDFAGIGEFIDRPMAIYSNGMRARLAFAIAFFQKADILLMDEVFATGDQTFIQKATALLLKSVQDTPISVLVSHDYTLISALCNRCVLIEDRRIALDGKAEEVLAYAQQKYGRTKELTEYVAESGGLAAHQDQVT